MNISNVKAYIALQAGISLPKLDLVQQYTKQVVNGVEVKVEEPWVSHWDNDSRVRVTMAKEIAVALKADPAMEGLAVKPVKVIQPGDRRKQSYRLYVVITPVDILLSI